MRASGFSYLLTVITIACSWALLVYPPMPTYTLLGDSEQYRSSAETILSGELLTPIDLASTPHLATAMRPPLFPFLVALARVNPLLAYPSSLVALHALIALALMVLAPIQLRRFAPPAAIALFMGIALNSAKQMLWAETSEWLALSLLITSTILLMSSMERFTRSSAFATALTLSLAALTRTALIPFLLAIPIIGATAPRPQRRRTITALSLGVAPLLLWCAAQYHRVGVFSIGAYEGLNPLATARSLGTLPEAPADSPGTRGLIAILNERGLTVSDHALSLRATHLWDGEFYGAFHHNFDLTCAAIKQAEPGKPPSSTAVAIRGFTAHPARYLRFIGSGIMTLARDYLPVVLPCLASAAWLRRRDRGARPLATVACILCCLSLLYLCTVFATMLWLPRYFLPLQPTIIFLSGVCAWNLVRNFADEIRER